MIDPVSQGDFPKRRFWIICLIILATAVIYWFVAPLKTDNKAPPIQPVARSTDWAPEPTDSAVPVNLPDTPMTNAPDKAP